MKKSLQSKPHAFGIAGLVLGILGIVLFLAPYIAIFLSITAIIFYFLQRKREPTAVATAGLVTGIIGLIINIVMLIAIITVLSQYASETSNETAQPPVDIDIKGGSFENAVIIQANNEKDGVDQEYQYLYKYSCQTGGGMADMELQELQKENNHIYDLLHVLCEDGTKEVYYFQIDSFFGKLE